MWRARPPDGVEVRRMRAVRERFDLKPLAIHVNYLINLASLDPAIRRRSIDGFRGELERAAAIGAEYVVIHPGSYRGHSVEEGIAAFVLGLTEAAQGFRARHLTVLLENAAGAGSHIGGRFEELRAIHELARRHTAVPIGYCLDTCHLFASGFNIATAGGLRATLQHAEETLGLAHVRLIHANDSKGVLGSRLDRHAHIGRVSSACSSTPGCARSPSSWKRPWMLRATIGATSTLSNRSRYDKSSAQKFQGYAGKAVRP
jgi:deoxyribonuclease-4